jgi:hypothetical protein
MVALVLREAGFVVRTAVNGLEALLCAYETRDVPARVDRPRRMRPRVRRPGRRIPGTFVHHAVFLNMLPLLDGLHNDRRFVEMLRRVALAGPPARSLPAGIMLPIASCPGWATLQMEQVEHEMEFCVLGPASVETEAGPASRPPARIPPISCCRSAAPSLEGTVPRSGGIVARSQAGRHVEVGHPDLG